MKLLVKALASIAYVLVMIASFYYFGKSVTELGWWGDQSPIPKALFAAAVMLFGIFFGCLFRQLRQRQQRISIWREVKSVFSSASFWTAICISPLVFFSFFGLTGDNPDRPATYLLAFQNGFFCEVVFNELFIRYQSGSSEIANKHDRPVRGALKRRRRDENAHS